MTDIVSKTLINAFYAKKVEFIKTYINKENIAYNIKLLCELENEPAFFKAEDFNIETIQFNDGKGGAAYYCLVIDIPTLPMDDNLSRIFFIYTPNFTEQYAVTVKKIPHNSRFSMNFYNCEKNLITQRDFGSPIFKDQMDFVYNYIAGKGYLVEQKREIIEKKLFPQLILKLGPDKVCSAVSSPENVFAAMRMAYLSENLDTPLDKSTIIVTNGQFYASPLNIFDTNPYEFVVIHIPDFGNNKFASKIIFLSNKKKAYYAIINEKTFTMYNNQSTCILVERLEKGSVEEWISLMKKGVNSKK